MTAPHTYITTTTPYVNARPHIGFALELVQADVLARYRRGRGDAVRFQAGTDDNSLKNVLAAEAAGVEVREFVDRNAEAFDYLTTGGRKISKSAGAPSAALEPAALAAQYGVDTVRWWLLREVPRVGDADFTVERLIARADDELANGLGNLVNRVVSMIGRYRDGRVPAGSGVPGGEELAAACGQADDAIAAALADFDFRRATAAVWAIAAEANRFVNRVRPWELAKAERTGDLAAGERLDAVLGVLLEACSVLGRVLTPFLPDAAARITGQCTPRDGRLPAPSPVFRRLALAS